MGSSVNKVILVGRLGKDPEIRQVGDQSVANLSLATDESYKDKNGDKQKKTEWHRLTVWGKAVESFIEPYLHSGDLIYVEGKLQTREWEKDGVKRYSTEVNVSDIKGLKTGDGESDNRSSKNSKPAARSNQRPAGRSQRDEDSDIGF